MPRVARLTDRLVRTWSISWQKYKVNQVYTRSEYLHIPVSEWHSKKGDYEKSEA